MGERSRLGSITEAGNGRASRHRRAADPALPRVSLVVAIWAPVDAATRPESTFHRAGQSNTVWIILPIVGLFFFFIVGGVLGIVYLAVIRPALRAQQMTPSPDITPPPPGWWLASGGTGIRPSQLGGSVAVTMSPPWSQGRGSDLAFGLSGLEWHSGVEAADAGRPDRTRLPA